MRNHFLPASHAPPQHVFQAGRTQFQKILPVIRKFLPVENHLRFRFAQVAREKHGAESSFRKE